MPASKTPSKNRTAQTWLKSLTKAVQIEQIPNIKEMIGMNHPGPIHLQAMFDGISKMIYEM